MGPTYYTYSDKLLLPCAHCGSVDTIIAMCTVPQENRRTWHVECCDCGVRTKDFQEPHVPCDNVEYNDYKHSMDKAIDSACKSWNTRANAPNETINSLMAKVLEDKNAFEKFKQERSGHTDNE